MVHKKNNITYTFQLSVAHTDVEQKYDLNKNIQEPVNTGLENITQIADLANNVSTISFLDETKHARNCTVIMLDMSSGNDYSIPTSTSCFWCCNSFSGIPIGCPLKYISNKAIKTYYSEISKDTYTIKENITPKRMDNILSKMGNDTRIQLQQKGYYECDGYFCSFNCCQSFIQANKHIEMYNMSEMLLLQIYNMLFDVKLTEIKPSPHWRMLKQFGGNLDIETYRTNFNKIEYIYHGIVKNIYKPIGHIWEERIKF